MRHIYFETKGKTKIFDKGRGRLPVKTTKTERNIQFGVDKSNKVVYRLDHKLSKTIKKTRITFRFYC